jgi:hypothetical protein
MLMEEFNLSDSTEFDDDQNHDLIDSVSHLHFN